jgi:hypothetical protein
LQWDKIEDKNSVIIIGVGAVVLLWFSSSLVSAINAIPLVRIEYICSLMQMHL